MTEPSHAVFLSYASQDAEAARRISEALCAAGIEVFFDQSELRGGEAWALKIRHEIQNCVLFIPIVSTHTRERLEGYFRHEWKLAIERTHRMAAQKAFLVPVVVDGTRGHEALVPDEFRAVQWTRLSGGDTPPAFVERIKHLLSPKPASLSAMPGAAPGLGEPAHVIGRRKALFATVAVVACAALAYLVADRFWFSRHAGTADAVTRATAEPGTAAFSPPPHSLAILPFVNISGDKEQEYFSDGLTEELLNSLSRISELQVAARTSSFSFQGEHPDIATVSHKLNVAAVLEGSVRRSGHTVRITAQLINGNTGFQLWSETYDRDLKDVLKLQTEVATAVAGALKVTLLGDEAARIEEGGTHNPAAFDAYLRATKAYWQGNSQVSIDGYTEAIRLDPQYALAYAARSIATDAAAPAAGAGADRREAQVDAGKAIALAPKLSEGHLALALVDADLLAFTQATEEFERALALGAGNARILRDFGQFAAFTGRGDFGLMLLHRAVALDPLNENSTGHLANALLFLRRYPEARAAFEETEALVSNSSGKSAMIGFTFYQQGDFERARSTCEGATEDGNRWICLAISYDKLGRQADAKTVLTRAQAQYGDSEAVGYAMVYAQWGNTAQALDWLEKANRAKSSYLGLLKQPMFDPLRKEPRFQAVERNLKYSD